ncbi:putative transmembrane cation transporter [Tsukamurella pulmonis]|uniref:Voltage-gated potassium channel n=1 Tax=Tsukamurella pulmonis TaxID=47312 RepID=A0A1H1GQQ9_9ACTN|nr:potassium channel family protein [Tsukamurella pulmonis]KXO88311.1 potassium transporter Kef [Tsukamurella pulmonis]KXP13289.1 potassium transporter Kef [Tsukamurella pulmonis]RDH09812.1 potassium transporter Kef [Tsukamurella pulmonis]SDR15471.1 voltage-gated potassium channel [Tsukamurella pulmonis]SUP16845.1 Voltage-gated potassium channel Kch [Tsukamurella pulmonis]
MSARTTFRRRSKSELTDLPDHALVSVLRIPAGDSNPWRAIGARVLVALGALFLAVFIVYIERDGYRDSAIEAGLDGKQTLTFLDCLYYATVSLSTTGYGDITPVTQSARLINVLLITPLRILFLIVLVGTTLQVLTERSRQAFKIQRWRSAVHNHTIVVGYGTKGRTAVSAMINDGMEPSKIVVVDTDQAALEVAEIDGLVTVRGDATKADVLRLAGAPRAASIIIGANRDDAAVMVTLTARELAPRAKIVASIRESENTHLLRQSGADSVVVSSETAGRLLGMATTTPSVVEMIEDLLSPGDGFNIAEREVTRVEVGRSPRHLPNIVLGVVRKGNLYRVDSPAVAVVEAGDRLLFVRNADVKVSN